MGSKSSYSAGRRPDPTNPTTPSVRLCSRPFEAAAHRFAPDVLLYHGVDRLNPEALRRARSWGLATALRVPDASARDSPAFVLADAVIVPTSFAADYYHEAYGRDCEILPDIDAAERLGVERSGTDFVTFVDPLPANGLDVFVRVADELASRRPAISRRWTCSWRGRPRAESHGTCRTGSVPSATSLTTPGR